MAAESKKEAGDFVRRNKAIVLILLLGLGLLLLPEGSAQRERGPGDGAKFDADEEKLAAVLQQIEGSGRVWVLLRRERDASAGGAVIVCDGAGSARVNLQIVQAVSAFTGLGSDKITVLKMKSEGVNQK